MLANTINVLLNGVAYGMLLFLMAAGLSVTMGLMGFTNMAHSAFAMVGGYITATVMNHAGWPFLLTLPVAGVGAAALGFFFERYLFRRIYGISQLDQVLLTVGLVYMSVASAHFFWGPHPQPIVMPSYLTGQVGVGAISIGIYQAVVISFGLVIAIALVLGIEKTEIGARIRAAVDNRRMALSCGVDVKWLFSVVFALGTFLAGLGGALSINLTALGPQFSVKYLVLILIVVVVGGLGTIKGTFYAAVLLGVLDVAGKYYFPELGSFVLYAVTLSVLLIKPRGLFGTR
jgi:branched-chain amino acid transport system permease protein